MASWMNSTKHSKKIQYLSFSNVSKKIEEEEILPNSFYEANTTLTPKPDKDNPATAVMVNYRPISGGHKCKNPEQNTSKLNTVHEKDHTS